MNKEIVIEAEEITTIPVTLVGKKYKVSPVKASLGVMMAKRTKNETDPMKAVDNIDQLVKTMFGKDAPKIFKRLEDPVDRLDYPHITKLVAAISEAQTGNPTT